MKHFCVIAATLSFTAVLFWVTDYHKGNTNHVDQNAPGGCNNSTWKSAVLGLHSSKSRENSVRANAGPDADNEATLPSLKTKKNYHLLRRVVYRVTDDAASKHNATAQKAPRIKDRIPAEKRRDGVAFRSNSVPESHIENDANLRDEEEPFFGRILQQSIDENPSPELVLINDEEQAVVDTQNIPTDESGPSPSSSPTSEPDDRFEFFNARIDDISGAGSEFDMYSLLLSSDSNERYVDWVRFRNIDLDGGDRFQYSATYRFRPGSENGHTGRDLSESQNRKVRMGFDARSPSMGSSAQRPAIRNRKIEGRDLMPSFHHELSKEAGTWAGADVPVLGRPLDFFIAGFPKCGTTTLLYAFSKHSETSISGREQCDLRNPNIDDRDAFSRLNNELSKLDPSTKIGIKCPTGLRTFHGIERLEQHSPRARLLVGVRHPIKFFQSFYNYRVTEIYDKGGDKDSIPPIESLVGSKEWKGVSTGKAQFELFLMQLGKTEMSSLQLENLERHPNMKVRRTAFKIFLYSVEQLDDSNSTRATGFRRDMQEFMQLRETPDPFGRENLNRASHTETIDICDSKYEEIRGLLAKQGAETRDWLEDQFLRNPDVIVGGKEYFLELIKGWGTDPCQQRAGPSEAQLTR